MSADLGGRYARQLPCAGRPRRARLTLRASFRPPGPGPGSREPGSAAPARPSTATSKPTIGASTPSGPSSQVKRTWSWWPSTGPASRNHARELALHGGDRRVDRLPPLGDGQRVDVAGVGGPSRRSPCGGAPGRSRSRSRCTVGDGRRSRSHWCLLTCGWRDGVGAALGKRWLRRRDALSITSRVMLPRRTATRVGRVTTMTRPRRLPVGDLLRDWRQRRRRASWTCRSTPGSPPGT